VSTFEGTALGDGWKETRKKVEGDIVFVPDWASLGPTVIKQQAKAGNIDGACMFDALSTWILLPFP